MDNQKNEVLNILTDRQLVYHPLKFIVAGEYEMSMDIFLFISHLMQSTLPNMLGEYSFTYKEFTDFTGRLKSTLSKPVDNWCLKLPSVSGFSLELKGEFEYVMYQLVNETFHAEEIYRDIDQSVSIKRQSFFLDWRISIVNRKSRQRQAHFVPNHYFIKAFVETNYLSVVCQDFFSIRGGKRVSLYPMLNYLIRLRNDQKIKRLPEVLAKYTIIREASQIDIRSDNYTAGQKISRTVAKIREQLDKILDKTSFSFTYRVDNNNFFFSFDFTQKNTISFSAQDKLNAGLFQSYIRKYFQDNNLLFHAENEKGLLPDHYRQIIILFLKKMIKNEQSFEIQMAQLEYHANIIQQRLDIPVGDIKSIYWEEVSNEKKWIGPSK